MMMGGNSNINGQQYIQYWRMGSGRMADIWYNTAGLQQDMSLAFQGSGPGGYPAYDRFGRMKDLYLQVSLNPADAVRIKHGYNYAGNRVYHEDAVSKAQGTPVYLDEYYTYDGLNRLLTLTRGQLDANKDAISGTPGIEEGDERGHSTL